MTRFIGSKPEGRLCLIGAPFDSTTSYRPGARFGPNALREASYGLETFSPALQADLEDLPFMDKGDLELPFGDPAVALSAIETAVDAIFKQDRTPVLLGGEHLVTLGAVRAAALHHQNLRIVHLDAHADLRDDYLGMPLSHATVIRRASEIVGIDRIRQLGIRSCDRQEFDLVRQLDAPPNVVIDWAGDDPVYLTIDLDILDPGCFPGTGTPEPGGWSFRQLTNTLTRLIRNLSIVAMDFVELAPMLDPSGASSITAAKVLRESLLAMGMNTSHQGGL